jgi:oligoendopeptidase F
MINLPLTAREFMDWEWTSIEPFCRELSEREIDAGSISAWLADWTRLRDLVDESGTRRYVAKTVDTTDQEAEQNFFAYIEHVLQPFEKWDNLLQIKLLDSGLKPAGFEIPLRHLRNEVELFREENLPLKVEEQRLTTRYAQITGAQTIEWEGRELTLQQLAQVYHDTNRARREKAWRMASQRQLDDRVVVNKCWVELLRLRRKVADNAGFADYRSYRWRELGRFDYTPEDGETFGRAVEEVVVPAVERLHKKRRTALGLDALRPWDLSVDPKGRAPLVPYRTVDELTATAEGLFQALDPTLGQYFATMRREELLDLENRKGKAPGGYCTSFDVAKRPFIFMNAVRLHDDVQTLLHEAGHCFHVFESTHLPYHHQRRVGMEFAEVASMAMELMAGRYLERDAGGFYTATEAARARQQHLEDILVLWPYIAVVDSFQNWVYTHPDEAEKPENCDACWLEQWNRFMKGVDYSGLEEDIRNGWHRKRHIFQVPFYYIEYGLAQLGAVQVWQRALEDEAGAVRDYRAALALGGTVSLPDLYRAAGARLAFDADTLRRAVELVERHIAAAEALS